MKNTKICSKVSVSNSFTKGIVFRLFDKPVDIDLEYENGEDPRRLLVYLNTEDQTLEVKNNGDLARRPLNSEERSIVCEEILIHLCTFEKRKFNIAMVASAEYYTLIDYTNREIVTRNELNAAKETYKSILEEFLDNRYGVNSSYNILRNVQEAYDVLNTRNKKGSKGNFYVDIDKDLPFLGRRMVVYFLNCVLDLKDSKYKVELDSQNYRIEFVEKD